MRTLTNDPPVLASIASPKNAAMATAVIGFVAMLAELAVVGAADDLIVVTVAIFVIPSITAVLAARAATQQRWAEMFGAPVAGAFVQAVGALVLAVPITGFNVLYMATAFVVALLAVVPVVVIVMPLLFAAGLIGARRDVEAGDAMLAAGGAWLVGTQLLGALLMPRFVPLFAPAILIGAFAIAAAITRGFTRRAWAKRVLRGQLDGWRIRAAASPDELAALPALYRPWPDGAVGVVERVGIEGTAYRASVVTEAVWSVGIRRVVTPLSP